MARAYSHSVLKLKRSARLEFLQSLDGDTLKRYVNLYVDRMNEEHLLYYSWDVKNMKSITKMLRVAAENDYFFRVYLEQLPKRELLFVYKQWFIVFDRMTRRNAEIPSGRIKKLHRNTYKIFNKYNIFLEHKRYQLDLSKRTEPQAVENKSTTVTEERTKVKFPKKDYELALSCNSENKEMLHKLKDVWEKASAVATQENEDALFLELSANSYIPDALRLYSKVIQVVSNEESKNRAESMFRSQIGTLTEHLTEIVNKGGDSSLRELEQHKMFLDSKLGKKE